MILMAEDSTPKPTFPHHSSTFPRLSMGLRFSGEDEGG